MSGWLGEGGELVKLNTFLKRERKWTKTQHSKSEGSKNKGAKPQRNKKTTTKR